MPDPVRQNPLLLFCSVLFVAYATCFNSVGTPDVLVSLHTREEQQYVVNGTFSILRPAGLSFRRCSRGQSMSDYGDDGGYGGGGGEGGVSKWT